MINIDYDQKVKEHHQMLVSKLRDFGSENLQYWVPDEDILNSLISMIFSISENNINKFNILINKNTIGNEKSNSLFESLSKVAKINIVEINDKINFQIESVDKNKLDILSKEISKKKNYNKTNKGKSLFNKHYFKTVDNKNIELIKELYFKSLNNLEDIDIIKKIKTKDNLNLIEIKYNNNIFYLDIYDDKVKKIYSNDNLSNIDRKFLSYLFKENKNLPIFEFCEHGLIRLESFLRPKQIRKYIYGSISQIFVRLLFQDLQNEFYKAWNKFKDKSNPDHIKNLYDLKLDENWIRLTKEEKTSKVHLSIKEFNKSIGNNLVNFSNLEEEFKIIVDFNIDNPTVSDKKPSILLDLEKFIKEQIDKRLEVFYKELKDENKLRVKNSPI